MLTKLVVLRTSLRELSDVIGNTIEKDVKTRNLIYIIRREDERNCRSAETEKRIQLCLLCFLVYLSQYYSLTLLACFKPVSSPFLLNPDRFLLSSFYLSPPRALSFTRLFISGRHTFTYALLHYSEAWNHSLQKKTTLTLFPISSFLL